MWPSSFFHAGRINLTLKNILYGNIPGTSCHAVSLFDTSAMTGPHHNPAFIQFPDWWPLVVHSQLPHMATLLCLTLIASLQPISRQAVSKGPVRNRIPCSLIGLGNVKRDVYGPYVILIWHVEPIRNLNVTYSVYDNIFWGGEKKPKLWFFNILKHSVFWICRCKAGMHVMFQH